MRSSLIAKAKTAKNYILSITRCANVIFGPPTMQCSGNCFKYNTRSYYIIIITIKRLSYLFFGKFAKFADCRLPGCLIWGWLTGLWDSWQPWLDGWLPVVSGNTSANTSFCHTVFVVVAIYKYVLFAWTDIQCANERTNTLAHGRSDGRRRKRTHVHMHWQMHIDSQIYIY